MTSEIADNKELRKICKQFQVRELHLFGSALNNSVEAVNDLDFQVLFYRKGTTGAFMQLMGLKSALEDLYGKEVDLVVGTQFRNPIFQANIDHSKQLVYAA